MPRTVFYTEKRFQMPNPRNKKEHPSPYPHLLGKRVIEKQRRMRRKRQWDLRYRGRSLEQVETDVLFSKTLQPAYLHRRQRRSRFKNVLCQARWQRPASPSPKKASWYANLVSDMIFPPTLGTGTRKGDLGACLVSFQNPRRIVSVIFPGGRTALWGSWAPECSLLHWGR